MPLWHFFICFLGAFRMSDWKLLSFYTTNTGSPFHLEDIGNSDFGDVEPITNGTDIPAAQELFCTDSNIGSCVAYLNQASA